MVSIDRPSTELTTPRLLLRRFGPGDVRELVALDRDPLVRRYVEDGEPVDATAAAAMIRYWNDQWPADDRYGFWAALDRSSGDFLGWFHLRPGDGRPATEPELGYRLVSSVWGRGLATEGSLALIDRAFADEGVERVVAETMVVNVASRRVMEKCGLRLVRVFHADWPVRIPGDEHGDVEYELTRSDWLARHAR